MDFRNTGTINVTAFSGTGNVINLNSLELTGIKVTPVASNLTNSINAYGEDTAQILLSPNSPEDSGPSTGTIERREIYEINGKSYEVLNKIGEGGSCQVMTDIM